MWLLSLIVSDEIFFNDIFIFYFIIYKIDKEYYEYKTKQNPRSMNQSHCSKKKFNFDLGSSPLV